MKVSCVLMAVLVVSACSRDPAVEPQDAAADDGRTVASTAGPEAEPLPDTPTPTDPPARRPRSEKPSDPSVANDARAAADGPVTQAAKRDGKSVSGAILEDFEERVGEYVEIRERAARDAPPLKETDDPSRIDAAQDARAASIRALRAGAKPGDIFTAEIRDTFRKLLAPVVDGEEGRDVKQVLRDDAPAPGAVPLEVNAKYPDNTTLPTVPATLLANLPELPDGLEYRIIGKDLVLLDSDANLIVDYIRNAIR